MSNIGRWFMTDPPIWRNDVLGDVFDAKSKPKADKIKSKVDKKANKLIDNRNKLAQKDELNKSQSKKFDELSDRIGELKKTSNEIEAMDESTDFTYSLCRDA